MKTMGDLWELPALTIAVAWATCLSWMGLFLAPSPPETSTDRIVITWEESQSESPAPTGSPQNGVDDPSNPRSSSHPARYQMGYLPLKVIPSLDSPLSIRYAAKFGGNAKIFHRTIPPGTSSIELPFYLGPRESELQVETVTCELLLDEGYNVGEHTIHTRSFRGRTPVAWLVANQAELIESKTDAVTFLLHAEAPLPTQASVSFRLSGTAFEQGFYRRTDDVTQFTIPAGGQDSREVLSIRREKSLSGANRQLILETLASNDLHIHNSPLKIVCSAAAAPQFSASLLKQSISEGASTTMQIRLLSGVVPDDGVPFSIEFPDKQLRVTPSTGSFGKEKSEVSIEVEALPDKLAFEGESREQIKVSINERDVVREVRVVDATSAVLRFSNETGKLDVKEGAKSPVVLTVELTDEVIAASPVAIPFVLTAPDDSAKSEITTVPVGVWKDKKLSGTLQIPAGSSRATLSLSSPDDERMQEPDLMFRLDFSDEGKPWQFFDGRPRSFAVTVVDDDLFRYIPITPVPVAESAELTVVKILQIKPKLSTAETLSFTIETISTAGPADYRIGLEKQGEAYRLPLLAGAEFGTIPIHAIADGIFENTETIKLKFPDTVSKEPIVIEVEDKDQAGSVLVLVIANDAIRASLPEQLKKLQALPVDLMARTVHLVDGSDTPYLGGGSIDLATLDYIKSANDGTAIEKAIAAWTTITAVRKPKVTCIVWMSDGAGQGTFNAWDPQKRPENEIHLVWLGGESEKKNVLSWITSPLEEIDPTAVQRLDRNSPNASSVISQLLR